MPHLCDKHQQEWDETDTATRQARMRTNQARPEHQKVRCVQCTCLLTYPWFQLCEYCAQRDRVCQQCSASTLSEEEQAEAQVKAEEQAAADQIIDDYTLIIKTYGRRSKTAERFCDQHSDLQLDRLDLFEIDSRLDRPVWREVLGSDIYQPVFCDECEQWNYLPALNEALECPHLAVGKANCLCHLCAVRQGRCACCGNPVE